MRRKCMGYNWTAADSDISFPEGFCAGLSSLLSLFSLASGLAEAGRATGIPSCCAQRWQSVLDQIVPSLFTSASQSVPAFRLAASVIGLSVQPLRVSTPSSSSLTHSHLPTNQIPLYKHQTPQPSRQRSPPSRTLGSETRHPRTDKPARVARSVARSPTPFASTAT